MILTEASWPSIVGALLAPGGALALLGAFLLRKWKERRVNHLWRDAGEAWPILLVLLTHTRAVRVLAITVKNGGGPIGFGSDARIHITEEVYETGVRPVREQFLRRPVDTAYSKMLADVHRLKTVSIMTEKLPPGLLKTHYEADGIVCSRLLHLRSTMTSITFLSLNLKDDGPMTPQEQSVIDSAVAKLSSILVK